MSVISLSTFRVLILSLLSCSLVSAQYAYNLDLMTDRNCTSAGNISCYSVLEDFESLKLGTHLQNGTMSHAYMPHFTVSKHGASNPIIPFSRPHYARSPGGQGSLVFTGEGQDFGGLQVGSLQWFFFACAHPRSPDKPEAVACSLTVTANTFNASSDTSIPPTDYSFEIPFAYTPGSDKDALMMFADFGSIAAALSNATNPPDPLTGPWFVHFTSPFNYTFKAVQADGSPAMLYFDSVLYYYYLASQGLNRRDTLLQLRELMNSGD